ncbi:esterase FE4-like [Arctopsyche grandis]|uniref:esterase FE4-like n=1 Tax=Arctopsyche grandis TaxID=121162 RepID=UPI00406D6606
MPELLVTVSEGKLCGGSRTTTEGFQYNFYLGIPYAKPPVGNLRFRDPRPPEKWDGIRDAVIQRDINPQFELEKRYIHGKEDSLFINVSTPSSATSSSKLPVIFYIHGGGFYVGNGNFSEIRPDYLVEKGVVFVSINYRLAPFGFLCLNTPEVPGNAGLKDQVFGLRWVQKNIHIFGGDPQNVTLMGLSAGAACVHYHLMSPMSRGLFVRAIMESGTCVSGWSTQTNPEQNAFELAEKLGLDTTDKQVALNFLQSVSSDDLVNASRIEFTYEMDILFCGTVEQRHPDVEPFLAESPLDMMVSGNYNVVPCICGLVSHEAIMFLGKNIISMVADNKFSITLDQIKVLIKRHANYDATTEQAKKMHYFYFKNDKNPIRGYIDMVSDMFFTRDGVKSVQIMSKHNKSVYFYLFGYGGDLNTVQPCALNPYDGASHAYEHLYIFKKEEDGTTIAASDLNVRKKLTTMWTNFAKSSNPTPTIDDTIETIWKPATETETNCLEIKQDLKMIKSPFAERFAFWKELF